MQKRDFIDERFESPQPWAIKRSMLKVLNRRDYVAAEKSDGEKVFVCLHPNGKVYLFDRKWGPIEYINPKYFTAENSQHNRSSFEKLQKQVQISHNLTKIYILEGELLKELVQCQPNIVIFDLIYARQDQTVASWQAELRQALDMAVDHLSLYQLTIEQGTAFADRYARGGLKGLPHDDVAADLYEATQEICAPAGMEAYEVSNHAKQGAESRHNLIYWRYGDYVGIGPGAHGRLTLEGQRYATEAWSNPDRWLAAVDAGQAEKLRDPIAAKDQAAEYLMMGLRVRDGIDLVRYATLAGESLPEDKIGELQALGMIDTDDRRLWATAQGRPVLNAVLRELLVA